MAAIFHGVGGAVRFLVVGEIKALFTYVYIYTSLSLDGLYVSVKWVILVQVMALPAWCQATNWTNVDLNIPRNRLQWN